MTDLKRLIRYVRPYKGRFAVSVLATALVALFTLSLAALVNPLVQQLEDPNLALVPPPGFSHGVPVYLLILFAFVGKGLFSYLSRYLMSWVGERAVADLRADVGRAIAHQSLEYFTYLSPGEFISRTTSDPEKVLTALSDKLYDFIKEPLTVLALGGYLFYIEWPLAVISLVLAPLVMIPVVRVSRTLRRASERSQESIADLSSRVHETVQGIRLVKASGTEEVEAARIGRAARRTFVANMRSVKVMALTPPLMEMLAGIGIAATFFYGQTRIASGALTSGDFLSFLTALFMLYQPAKKMTRVQAAFEQALASAARCFELIDAPVRVVDSPTATPLGPVKGEVRFEHVSFGYQAATVLDKLDFLIPSGTVVALVGPSGAGKSTIASLILRFYDPTAGRITLDGRDLREVTLLSLRRSIGFVPQDVILFNDTLRANIAYGMDGVADARVEECARAAYAHDFITELADGYATMVGEGGVRLSTGQRQRIAIARALLKDPPLLVLDEATSALDSESEASVVRALENLMSGRTTLVIAHRLSTVRRADRILALERGALRESGTHDELMRAKGGLYNRLLELQRSGDLHD